MLILETKNDLFFFFARRTSLKSCPAQDAAGFGERACPLTAGWKEVWGGLTSYPSASLSDGPAERTQMLTVEER